MDTAEISLIVSGIAAAGSAGTAIATYKLGVRRFRHERELADTADARTILAEAALQLGQMKGSMKNALSAFQKPLEDTEQWPAESVELIHRLEAAAEALDGALVGVRIRFKRESRVARELAEAADRVREIMARYMQAYKRSRTIHPRKNPEIDFEFVWEKSLDFDARVVGFLEAAEQSVGVKLSD